MNSCSSVAWQGGNKPLALKTQVALIAAFGPSAILGPIDSLWDLGQLSLGVIQALLITAGIGSFDSVAR